MSVDTPPPPRRLTYDVIRRKAESFLQEHWAEGTIPVDIEQIADVGLGIDIIPVPGMRRAYGMEGYLSTDGTSMAIDPQSCSRYPTRCRFTIAEEVGHFVLHGELLEAATYDTIEEYYAFRQLLSPEHSKWYEWQARCFAGLTLVPAQQLRSEIDSAISMAGDMGFPINLSEDAHVDYISQWVAKRFHVSSGVLKYRGTKDGFWNTTPQSTPEGP